MSIEKWGLHELTLTGPSEGNPFALEFQVTYQFRNRMVTVDGFYDGDGVYRARFSPDREGEWSYITSSSAPELDGQCGTFVCSPPGPGNHGPVDVLGKHHFSYTDGTRYDCVGLWIGCDSTHTTIHSPGSKPTRCCTALIRSSLWK